MCSISFQDRARVNEMLFYDANVVNRRFQDLMVRVQRHLLASRPLDLVNDNYHYSTIATRYTIRLTCMIRYCTVLIRLLLSG